MCFWCWLTNGVAWSTSTSRPIRPRSGVRSNCGRHFLSIKFLDIGCGIAIRSSAMTSAGKVADMKIQEVLSAPRSPWQRAYVERVIGSIRRECLDHVIVFNETGLRRMLSVYFSYYHETRPHLSLEKDSPEPWKVQPPELGQVVAVPQVGGLHHRYERCAA